MIADLAKATQTAAAEAATTEQLLQDEVCDTAMLCCFLHSRSARMGGHMQPMAGEAAKCGAGQAESEIAGLPRRKIVISPQVAS